MEKNHITHLVIGETPADLSSSAPSMYETLTHKLDNIEIDVLEREKVSPNS